MKNTIKRVSSEIEFTIESLKLKEKGYILMKVSEDYEEIKDWYDYEKIEFNGKFYLYLIF